jgi:hypothetical protein
MERETILRALEDRRCLEVTYGTDGIRVVQPHAIVRKTDGTEILEAYQVRGHSESGVEHGWRHFEVARVWHAEMLPEQFEPRRDFRPVSGRSGLIVAAVRRDEALQA